MNGLDEFQLAILRPLSNRGCSAPLSKPQHKLYTEAEQLLAEVASKLEEAAYLELHEPNKQRVYNLRAAVMVIQGRVEQRLKARGFHEEPSQAIFGDLG